jgi:hypothetical protein
VPKTEKEEPARREIREMAAKDAKGGEKTSKLDRARGRKRAGGPKRRDRVREGGRKGRGAGERQRRERQKG